MDDDPDSPTPTDYINNTLDGADCSIFLELVDTPADFSSLTSVNIKIHVVPTGFVSDTCDLYAQIFQSDETTSLTDELKVADQASSGMQTVTLTNPTASNKSTWDGARVKLRWDYTIAVMEGATLRATAVEFDVTYAEASSGDEDASVPSNRTLAPVA